MNQKLRREGGVFNVRQFIFVAAEHITERVFCFVYQASCVGFETFKVVCYIFHVKFSVAAEEFFLDFFDHVVVIATL